MFQLVKYEMCSCYISMLLHINRFWYLIVLYVRHIFCTVLILIWKGEKPMQFSSFEYTFKFNSYQISFMWRGRLRHTFIINRIHTHKLLDIAMSKICLASNSLNESISYSNYLNCDFLELQKQLWDNCKSYHICKNYLHGRIMANLSSGQRY